MRIEDYLDEQKFIHLGCVRLERRSDGEPIIDNPQRELAEKDRHAKLTPPFCRLRLPDLPRSPGVYILVVAGQAKYVGSTTRSLANRWSHYRKISPGSCKRNGQPTNCRINHQILKARRRGQNVHLWFRNYRTLENRMIKFFEPPWNT